MLRSLHPIEVVGIIAKKKKKLHRLINRAQQRDWQICCVR